MRELEMDLWDAPPGSWVGIPTNGTVTTDGRLVMGAGVAKEARDRFRGIDRNWGLLVSSQGNVIHPAQAPEVGNRQRFDVFSFPTKNYWRLPASVDIIARSAEQLGVIARFMSWTTFYLPRPGCGLGGLKWEDVRPVIVDLLPDNVIVVHKGS